MYVYVIRNAVNGKVYVGQTKNATGRKAGHWYGAAHGARSHLYDSMRKHGIENFSFEILEECEVAEVDDRERFWIAHFGSCDPQKGYNKETGGHALKQLTPETRAKISESLSRVVFTAERCANISRSRMGKPILKGRRENNPVKSQRISAALTGRSLSTEHRRAVSEGLKAHMARRGEWHPTQEAIARMSVAQREVGKRRTATVMIDPSDADAQPKECPVCRRMYSPKSLKRYDVKRHMKKRWCSRSCGRTGQNRRLRHEHTKSQVSDVRSTNDQAGRV